MATNRQAELGARVIFRIETPNTGSTKTLPCKEGESVVVLKAAMMSHLLSSISRSETGHSDTPLMPDRYLFAHLPTGQLFMDFTPISWVIKATGQTNKKVKQLWMLCIDIGREDTPEAMKMRQNIVYGTATSFKPQETAAQILEWSGKKESVIANTGPPARGVSRDPPPPESVLKLPNGLAPLEIKQAPKKKAGTGGCGSIFTCTACTSDTWSRLMVQGSRTMPCSVCEIDTANLFVCGGCGTEVCDQCIHPDAKLQGEDDDDSPLEKYDVDDYVDTRRWKTKELTLSPGELGIMFGPQTFRNRFDSSYNAEPELFICVHELDQESQCNAAARKAFGNSSRISKISDTLPWIITELNNKPMPNSGQKATGNTDDDVDNDIDIIFDEMQKACSAEKPYSMKVLYLDEVSRALGQARSSARRGARRC